MFLFLLLAFAAPAFAEPLPEAVAGRLSFADVPVWYLKEQGKGSVVLGGSETFTFPLVPPQKFFPDFPSGEFLYGHIYNKINGQPRTNHVFIRKDKIKSQWHGAGRVTVVLEEGYAKNPPERVRLNRIVRPKYSPRGGS